MLFFNKRHYKNIDTEELVLKAQNDDIDALEELIKRYQNTVYATFYYLNKDSHDILDLTQEALVKMSRNIKSLREPKKFKSWLNQIVTNIFYDHIRKNNRKPDTITIEKHENPITGASTPIELVSKEKNPEEHSLGTELNSLIESSIQKLPNSFKLAIVLREFQGLSYEEIANITETSVGTVKSRIARARNKLQEELKAYIA